MFRRCALLTGLLVLLLTLTSCQSFAIPADSSVTNESSTVEVDADTDTQTTLRVGYLPFISYAPLYIAAEKGYYAEQGLEVELQRFRSGSLMIAPLSTGQLDVGAGQAGAVLFNAAEQALDVKIAVAGPSERKGSTVMPFLIHRALVDNGTVTSLSDLAGRRVAINVEGGVDEYMTARILAQVGLSLDDVQMTTLSIPDQPTAYANEAIDASIVPFPLAGQVLNDESAQILVDISEVLDGLQTGVVYFGQHLLTPENEEVGVRFLIAYLQAARDLQGDGWRSEENLTIIQQYTEVPMVALENGAPPYVHPDGEINTDSLADQQLFFIERGYANYKEPLSIDQLLAPQFLEQALAQLGEFEQ